MKTFLLLLLLCACGRQPTEVAVPPVCGWRTDTLTLVRSAADTVRVPLTVQSCVGGR